MGSIGHVGFGWGTALVQLSMVLYLIIIIGVLFLFVKLVINSDRTVKSLKNIENRLNEMDEKLQGRSQDVDKS